MPFEQNESQQDSRPESRDRDKDLGGAREVNQVEHRTRQAFIAAVLTVYVVSFFLPAINAIPGWGALLMNLFVVWVPSWAANPLLLVGLYSFNHGQYGKTAILGFIALLLGTIWLWGLLFDHDQNTGLGPGYWVWLGSMALLILGAAICACQKETFCQSDGETEVQSKTCGDQ